LRHAVVREPRFSWTPNSLRSGFVLMRKAILLLVSGWILLFAFGDGRLDAQLNRAAYQPRSQEPQRPYSYDEEEVLFENVAAGVKLAGTLTIPRSSGRHPAILLIAGGAPLKRDCESLGNHKIFLVLADYLTNHGVIVLRYDKRGVGGSTGNHMTATLADFTADARAGLEFLKGHHRVAPESIGLLGHSEGGLIGPALACESGDVAYMILLSSPGVRYEANMYSQLTLKARARNLGPEPLKEKLAAYRSLVALAQQRGNDRERREAVVEVLIRLNSPDPEISALYFLGGHFRSLLDYDPVPAIRKCKCPVLALHGSKDLVVAPLENLNSIDSSLRAGGNRNCSIKMLGSVSKLAFSC
jgi:pimeloyl-ACP methyl ester carboxylesterase